MDVLEFKGEYAFLSNFYECTLLYRGTFWPTVEHAYQASKCLEVDEDIRLASTPQQAKRMGRRLPLRNDWEEVKDAIMCQLVYLKFEQNPYLAHLLLQIDGRIEEGNWWHDNYWGVCYCKKCLPGVGKNVLGNILMNERDFRMVWQTFEGNPDDSKA